MPYPMLFLAFALALSPFPAQAQTIAEVFESAWRRSSPASGAIQRGDALLARRDAADLHTPAPPSLELGGRSDRLNQDRGARELEVGVALQLWLPGEQDRTRALAEAERGEFEARLAAARLRLAAEVREAWWAWQPARIEARPARDATTHWRWRARRPARSRRQPGARRRPSGARGACRGRSRARGDLGTAGLGGAPASRGRDRAARCFGGR